MNSRLVSRSELSAETRDDMFRLLAGQFENVRRDVFLADLEGKNWVLLMEDPAGRVTGFTTLLHYHAAHRGRPVQVVYSGDTVVHPSAAGTSVLWRSWLGAVNRLRGDDPAPLYWLLIVSGFRTYRFMTIFWKDFHPRRDTPMTQDARELRDALARERFGSRFDAASGVVLLPSPQVLRPELREVPAHCALDPDVAFFVRADPGHARGDELVCLTEIAYENLTRAGRRMWEAGEHRVAGNGAHP